nr:IS1380 family transposase [Microbulbifer rhizosphaerae]
MNITHKKTVSRLVELVAPHRPIKPKETVCVKFSKAAVHRKTHALPTLRFEDQKLTSYAGLVVFQSLFAKLGLKEQLTRCFRHLTVSPIFGHGVVTLLLIVHLLLGHRRLQDMRYYQDDPLVKRLLGVSRLPDVATVSRTLSAMDGRSVEQLRQVSRQLVGLRLQTLRLARVTLDFDGSVIATGRFAEGSAVGFNRKKKGQRSYYPLFCSIAQTGQIFDVWHRPGNVHDSNGAQAFIKACIHEIRAILPHCIVEVRMDGAFFSDAIVTMLEALNVEFTISVPFERFVALKSLIEHRKRWRSLNERWSYFETDWKPKSWHRRHRFVCVRQRNRVQHKGAVQLDLFVPYEYGYDFKVIVTNKRSSPKKVLTYHNGRGAQEGLFAELKSQTQMDYVPTQKLVGNQVYVLAAMLAHNLNREMQMQSLPKARQTTERRAPLWQFEQLGTLRRKLIQRAGRLTKPQGQLTLTMSANPTVKSELLHYMNRLKHVA